MNFAQAAARNALFKGAGEAAVRLLSFVFVVLVARRLGQSEFGALNFGLSFPLLFVVLIDFGFNPLLVRDAGREPSRLPQLFFNLLIMKCLLAALFAGAVWAGLAVANPGPEMRFAALMLAVFVALNSFTEFFNAVFQAGQQMQWEALTLTLQKTTLLILGLAAVYLGWGLTGVAAAYVAAGACGLTAAAALLAGQNRAISAWTWDRGLWLYALRQALPLALTTLFVNLYFRIDMTLLARWRPAAELGWYGAAHKCIEVLMVIPAVLSTAVFPGMARLFVEDPARLRAAASKMLRLMLLLAMPLALGAWTLAGPLMAFIFGPAFAPAGTALAWLAVALGFIFLNYPLSYLLISAGRQKANAAVSALAALANILANAVLIPRWGYAGAAASAALTEALLFAAYWLAVRRLVFKPEVGAVWWRAGVAGLVMAGAVWNLRAWHPLAGMAAGALIYCLAAWLGRAAGAGEWDMVKKIWTEQRHA